MMLRPMLAGLAVIALAGCDLIPAMPSSTPAKTRVPIVDEACGNELPSFVETRCLLDDWIALGLSSQRGDRGWRDITLARLEGERAERRLARAVVLAWGTERQWDQASELFKADLEIAPETLQPLLRYWLNELEGRRALTSRLAQSRQAQASLERLEREKAELEASNAELLEKLEALTAIERSINSRQQNE